jgi:hypothetical protein
MSEKVSDKDYVTLERFIKGLFERHHHGQLEIGDATGKLMHSVTALLESGLESAEGFPVMKTMISEWGREAAARKS